jgi:hypothetical protein
MGILFSSLRRVTAVNPPLFVAYGVHGVGKTTFSAEWPRPVFIQVENGTPGGIKSDGEEGIDSLGDVRSFSRVLDLMGALLTEAHDFKTVVVDSLDAMEPLIWSQVCEEKRWVDIEHGSDGKSMYGKGYAIMDKEWREFLSACKTLTASGVAVVLIAHSEVFRYDSPTTEPYSRYGPKLHKRAAALVQEEADIVGFFNYRMSLKEADVGFKKIKHGVGGGARVIHLEERPGFLAKNHYKMPESIDYVEGKGYSAVAKYFPQPTGLAPVQQAAE